MSAMTLKKGSRSNCWYVRKHLDRCVLTADWFDYIPYSLWIRHQCFPHMNTCTNWTLTPKDLKICHSDLVLGVIGRSHLRCLETWNELCSSFHVNFCRLLTDRPGQISYVFHDLEKSFKFKWLVSQDTSCWVLTADWLNKTSMFPQE